MTRLAAIGKHVGVDLWAYRDTAGRQPVQGRRLLIPTATGGLSHWPYQDIGFTQYAALDSLARRRRRRRPRRPRRAPARADAAGRRPLSGAARRRTT